MVGLSLHLSDSTLDEEDPVDHLRLVVRILEREVELGVVRLLEVEKDGGGLPDIDGALGVSRTRVDEGRDSAVGVDLWGGGVGQCECESEYV